MSARSITIIIYFVMFTWRTSESIKTTLEFSHRW